MSNRYGRSLIIGAILVIAIVTVFTIRGKDGIFGSGGSVDYQIDSGILGISCLQNTEFIQISDITDVELLEELDTGQFLSGEETANIRAGTYYNEELGTYTAYIYNKIERYILVRYTDGVIIWNLASAKSTESAFQSLKDVIEVW